MSSLLEHHPPTPSPENQAPPTSSSLQEVELRMREQIRVLQEQRAAAMMNEIVELQRERDLAMGKIRRLEKIVAEVQTENTLLRSNIGRENLTERISFLERSLLEEQLLSRDLRRKLQRSSERVQKMEMGRVVSPETERLGGAEGERERSRSMSDLQEPATQDDPGGGGGGRERGRVERSLSGSGERREEKVEKPLQLRKLTANGSPHSAPVSPSPSPQSYSPTVIPRRYKLAAVICRDFGTQTDSILLADISQEIDQSNRQKSDQSDCTEASGDDGLPDHIAELLTAAKEDILRAQREKELMETRMSAEIQLREKERERQRSIRKDCESLQVESGVLQDSLQEFSRWVRNKLRLLEEDLDIFRVVYSLHGSLSQEAALLEEMREKLLSSETRVAQLETANRHLTQTASEAEEKYQHSQNEIRQLRERLTSHSHTSSPLELNHHAPRPFKRSNRSSPHISHRHPSPLIPHRHSHQRGDRDIV